MLRYRMFEVVPPIVIFRIIQNAVIEPCYGRDVEIFVNALRWLIQDSQGIEKSFLDYHEAVYVNTRLLDHVYHTSIGKCVI